MPTRFAARTAFSPARPAAWSAWRRPRQRQGFLHPLAGVLSAYGMGMAEMRSLQQRSVEQPLSDELLPELESVYAELEGANSDLLADQGVDAARLRFVRRLMLKVAGSDTPLVVSWDGDALQMVRKFHRVHRSRFGFEPTHFTLVIEPVWRAGVNEFGHVVLSRHTPRPVAEHTGTEVDPVMLEVFNNLFMHIAEQMGVVLENTAHSVNIKERLDFSCGVFDPDGDLIANAPHMPVHLGSMGDSVKTILAHRCETMKPGDAFMLNAPYNGGTHLPDVTVVTPVFDAAGKKLIFSVACRAHHADIGGISPGSMPATSASIHEEGVLIDNVRLVGAGMFRELEVRELLASGAHPARNPDRNVADFKAQIAANTRGVAELGAMVEHFGLDVVHAYMLQIKRNAEECVRDAIAALYVFRTLVEDDIPLNQGCMKPLTIHMPDASLVNPRYPAAVAAGNVETSQCITDALLAALNVCAAATA